MVSYWAIFLLWLAFFVLNWCIADLLGWPRSSFGFFIRCYGKIQMNVLANSVQWCTNLCYTAKVTQFYTCILYMFFKTFFFIMVYPRRLDTVSYNLFCHPQSCFWDLSMLSHTAAVPSVQGVLLSTFQYPVPLAQVKVFL